VVCCVRNVPTSSRLDLEVIEIGSSRGGEKCRFRFRSSGDGDEVAMDV
jgi:hypothetical protein